MTSADFKPLILRLLTDGARRDGFSVADVLDRDAVDAAENEAFAIAVDQLKLDGHIRASEDLGTDPLGSYFDDVELVDAG